MRSIRSTASRRRSASIATTYIIGTALAIPALVRPPHRRALTVLLSVGRDRLREGTIRPHANNHGLDVLAGGDHIHAVRGAQPHGAITLRRRGGIRRARRIGGLRPGVH